MLAGTKVRIKTGADRTSRHPEADVYGWQTLSVTRFGQTHTLHTHAIGTIEVDDQRFDTLSEAEQQFERLTGFAPDQWMRAYDRYHRNDIEDPMGCLSQYE